MAGLERLEDGPSRHRGGEIELHLALKSGEGAERGGQLDPDHERVWTSTDSTAGRSRTIGAHVSPAFADA